MTTKEIKKTTSFFSEIPISLSYHEMSETVRLWIHKILSGDNPNKNYIFAKIKWDDTILFYTEEGHLFYEVKFECRLPVEMYSDKLLVGLINTDNQNEESEVVKFKAKLVANPKESDKMTSGLAKFREEIIERYRL